MNRSLDPAERTTPGPDNPAVEGRRRRRLGMLRRRRSDPTMWSRARKIGVAIAGGIVFLAGLVMIVLPGPGIAVMLLGFGIWAAEFVWARRLLRDLRRRGKAIVDSARGRGDSSTPG